MTHIKILITGLNYGGKIHGLDSIVDVQDKELVEDLVGRGYAREATDVEVENFNAAQEAEGGSAGAGKEPTEVDYKKLSKPKLATFALEKGITLDESKTQKEMVAVFEEELAKKEAEKKAEGGSAGA